jgi:multidrug resistance efflux pump
MKEKRKLIMLILVGILVVAVGGIGGYYLYNGTYFISTDDAKVTGDLVKVSPQSTGRLLELNVAEGDTVVQDQILGRQEALNLSDVALEQAVIRAPISGIVVKKQGNVGEIVSAGQSLAVIVDQAALYVSANIEEDKVGKIAVGQRVEIAIDQYPGVKFTGKVSFIGEAANSAFSLLPTSTSGVFTKVVQKIPVKIKFDHAGWNLAPGTNSVVKIHIR